MKQKMTIGLCVAAGLLSALGASAHVQPSAHPRLVPHKTPKVQAMDTCQVKGPVTVGFGRIYLVICE